MRTPPSVPDRMKKEDMEVLGRAPVAAADLEPGRGDSAHALPPEADQVARVALVDDEAEIADRRAPVGAGGEDVAEPVLGIGRHAAFAAPRRAFHGGDEVRIDAVARDRLAAIVAGADLAAAERGHHGAAEAGPVAMLDGEVAAGREDLLPIPGLLHRPPRPA